MYRFDANLSNQEISKITQALYFLSQSLSNSNKILSSYMLINPADARMTGTLAFNNPVYYKLVTNYELERLRNRKTTEDKEIYDSLQRKQNR